MQSEKAVSYTFDCPHCDNVLTLATGAQGRTRCPNCTARVYVSDPTVDFEWIRERFNMPTGRVTVGGKNFKTKGVRVDQELAKRLMGSSREVGDSIYCQVWLVSPNRASIEVWLNGSKAAELPSSRRDSLLKTTYSNSPFIECLCAVRCPAKLTVQTSSKRVLEICAIESPPTLVPRPLPMSTIDHELLAVMGKLEVLAMEAKDLTLRQSLTYLAIDDEAAKEVRLSARSNPAGPKYYFLPEDVPDDTVCQWTSYGSDLKYSAIMRVNDGVISQLQLEVTRSNPLVIDWLADAPPLQAKLLSDSPPKLPTIWRDQGRTATLVLRGGLHHPATIREQICHCWTYVSGLEFNNSDGRSRYDVLASVAIGDELFPRRDPRNQNDSNAIAFWTHNDEILGYLPSAFAAELKSKILYAIAYERRSHAIASGAAISTTFSLSANGLTSNTLDRGLVVLVVICNGDFDQNQAEAYARQVFASQLDPNW